jgi:hypothetical protein
VVSGCLFKCKECLLTIVDLMLKKHSSGTNKRYGNYLFNHLFINTTLGLRG